MFADRDLAGTLRSAAPVELVRRPAIFRIPAIHDELISDERIQYLIIKGGRGGFKTTSYLCAMIEESYRYRSCAFLFTREIAKSIQDSVYAVVKDLIEGMGEGECYTCRGDGRPFKFSASDFDVTKTEIVNKRTGVRFLFTGLRSTGGKTAMSQINKVKGLHKIRMVMMEEGQDLSEDGLNVLLPTVNRKGSAALVRDMIGHRNYRPRKAEAATAAELEEARFLVAMNPNRDVDPVISKFSTFIPSGRAVIAHINMDDIGGQLGDTEPRTVEILVNGETWEIETEPDLQDAQLLNQMELERGMFYWGHVWKGEAFHRFAGLPWSQHRAGKYADHEIECLFMWLDPSFKGGDFTALSAIGRVIETGQVVAWGWAWKSAWNMEPAISGIADAWKKWHPDRLWFEDNSLGTVPKSELAKYGIPSIGITSLMNKEDKIYKAAAFTVDLIELATEQACPVWLKGVLEYTDEADHDDPPDSLASLICQTGLIKERLKF